MPGGNDCGLGATATEHFNPARRWPCGRRYLATPLREIILTLAKGRGARECGISPVGVSGQKEAAGENGFAMDAKTNIKSRLPSRHVTEGPERAPHRSYLYAMGLTTEQIHQPFVGVASCWNEAAPCNISLMRQAQAVKKGVRPPAARRANSAPSP